MGFLRNFIGVWFNEKEHLDVETSNIEQELATRKRRRSLVTSASNVLPNPDRVLKNANKGAEAYEDLLHDAHVWSCIQSRKSGVLSLRWEINKEQSVPEARDLVQRIFNALDLPSIIAEMLDAPMFGYSVSEILWERDAQGNLVPNAVAAKPREWFLFTDEGEPRFKTDADPKGIALPEKKFLVVQHQPQYTNPYGRAILAQCYWAVTFKRQLMRFALRFAEKYGMPYLVGKYDPDLSTAEEQSELYNVLENMIQDGVITVPIGQEVSMLEAGRSSSVDSFVRFITYYNAEISKAILSQTLTTEQGETGSYAMSQTHLQVRSDVVAADKRLIERALNQLARWITELNFAQDTEPPTVKFFEESEINTALADRDAKLLSAKMLVFTRSYIEKAYNLSPTDFDIPDPEAPAPMSANPENSATSDVLDIPKPPQPRKNPPKPVATAQNPQPTTQNKGTDDISRLRAFSAAIANTANELETDDANSAMDKMLRPVIDLIDNGATYEEVNAKLPEMFPDMDTSGLEDMLSRALFASQAIGATI